MNPKGIPDPHSLETEQSECRELLRVGAACEAAAAAWDWLLLVLSHFLDEHVSAGGCLAWRHASESRPGPGPATGPT